MSSSSPSSSPQRLIVLPLRVRFPSHRPPSSYIGRHLILQDHGGCYEEVIPQPPVRLHLHFLPDLVHDAITSFLTTTDLHRMMEVDHQIQELYGGRITNLVVNCEDIGHIKISSLLKKRHGLARVGFINYSYSTMGEIVKAMRSGHCNRLQCLEMGPWSMDGKPPDLPRFFQVLGEQALCPRLHRIHLRLSGDYKPYISIRALGDALRSRMRSGRCCGLKTLSIKPMEPDRDLVLDQLSPLLSSGACEELEVLELDRCEFSSDDALKDWLERTRAASLRVWSCDLTSSETAAALCAEGVATGLRSFQARIYGRHALDMVVGAVWWAKWRELQVLKVTITEHEEGQEMVQRLIEAIRTGAPALKVLGLSGPGVGPEGGAMLAQALRDGAAFPQLEDLDLSGGDIGDLGLMELAWTVDEDSCRSGKLHRVNLSSEEITPEGMLELSEAMAAGAYANLESLDLSDNYELGDEGVMYLSQSLEAGGLPHLKELSLERVGVSDAGVEVLSNALVASHACLHLERLSLKGNEDLSSKAYRSLVRALDAKRGRGKVRVEYEKVPAGVRGLHDHDYAFGGDYDYDDEFYWEDDHFFVDPNPSYYRRGPMPVDFVPPIVPPAAAHANLHQQQHRHAPPPYQHHRHQHHPHSGGKGGGRRR